MSPFPRRHLTRNSQATYRQLDGWPADWLTGWPDWLADWLTGPESTEQMIWYKTETTRQVHMLRTIISSQAIWGNRLCSPSTRRLDYQTTFDNIGSRQLQSIIVHRSSRTTWYTWLLIMAIKINMWLNTPLPPHPRHAPRPTSHVPRPLMHWHITKQSVSGEWCFQVLSNPWPSRKVPV